MPDIDNFDEFCKAIEPKKVPIVKQFDLNEEQVEAVRLMQEFMHKTNKESFFLLSGAAGTGKTTTVKGLMGSLKDKVIFTAPTNKATKILRSMLSAKDFASSYTPECRTIYSLLGLKMEPDGEVRVLSSPEDPVDLSRYAAVVIDEGSMISHKLHGYIEEASDQVKFIYMADYYQLPPVEKDKSQISPIWEVKNRVDLLKIVRYDNQILNLATEIRGKVDQFCPSIKFKTDKDENGGVDVVGSSKFINLIREDASAGLFSKQNAVKAIAWRNVTVEALNKQIRQQIFTNTTDDFLSGDRIILMEPAKDFINEGTIANTDDEGTIEKSLVEFHPIYKDILCHRVLVQIDDGHPITLWKVHNKGLLLYQKKMSDLAAEAKQHRWKWRDYWKFRESFHNFRYGYAITAHRAQGSTYEKVFVNTYDILQNRNRSEAFRCLYVACTRPKNMLVIT